MPSSSRKAAGIPAEPIDAGLSAMPVRPLQFHVVVDLLRAFDREEVARAAAGVVRVFPVLGCRFVPRFFRDRWVPDPEAGEAAVEVSEVEDVDAATRAWA